MSSAPCKFEFDAFASYSTDPDYKLVQQTEGFLEGFHTIASSRRLKLPPLKICVDGSDFSLARKRAEGAATAQIEQLVQEYLSKSRQLIVFCSRGSVKSDWVDKEIDWWLQHRDANDILLAVAEGDNPAARPAECFPARAVAAGLHLRPWYDFRSFCGRSSNAWTKVRDAEAERVQLAAHLYGDTAGRVYPAWQRQRDRQRRMLRWTGAVSASLGLAWACWFAWTFTDAYQVRKIVQQLTAGVPDDRTLRELVRHGYIAEAKFVTSPADERKPHRLEELATALLAKGHRDEARAMFESALNLRLLSKDGSSRPEAEAMVNAILAGADNGLVKRIVDRVLSASDVGSTVATLADKGALDQAVALAKLMPVDTFQCADAAAWVRLGCVEKDDAKAIEHLDKAWEILKLSLPAVPKDDGNASPELDNTFLVTPNLALAYADRGEVASISRREIKRDPVPWNPSSKTLLPKRAANSINRSNARSFATGYQVASPLRSLPRNWV